MGINIAASHGMVFGRDIIFNYGPWGPAAIAMYYPGTRGIMIAGAAIMATALSVGWVALSSWLAAALALCMLPLLPMTDPMVFALPLPAIVLCAQLKPAEPIAWPTVAASMSVMPALALATLMKGSFIAAALIGAGAICLLSWRSGHRRFAEVLAMLGAVSLPGLWMAAGQQITALPPFFAGALRIIAGHNEGMASQGPFAQVAVVAAIAAALLAILAWRMRHAGHVPALVTTSALAGLLFLAFKAGFVRQDSHVIITYGTLGLICALLAGWLWRGLGAAAAALACACLFANVAGGMNITDVPAFIAWHLADEFHSTYRVLFQPAARAADYARMQAAVPQLPWHPAGTADAYSSLQARLFASDLAWDPRPVFQSYNVTTPMLGALNLDHLLGAAAADNIFFRIEPIDGRLPALEDGLSWPALLSYYDPAGYDGASQIAWLRRARPAPPLPEPGKPLFASREKLGATIALPVTGQDIWAQIDVRRSLAGAAAALLWHAPPLTISIGFADGTEQSFQFVPGMGQAGFLLSPFVASTLDFLRLRARRDGARNEPNRPVWVSLAPPRYGRWSWRSRYHIRLSPIGFPPSRLSIKVQGVVRPQAASLPNLQLAGACALDLVDRKKVPAQPMVALWPVRLDGWGLFAADLALQADSIDIGFRAQSGQLYSVSALTGIRGDVGLHYHIQADRAGFSTLVDFSHLPSGQYSTVVIFRYHAEIRACAVPLSVIVSDSI